MRKITDGLDAVGNTTAAIGKGFAIGSAALTALALFAAYTESRRGWPRIDLTEPTVIVGLFLGGIDPVPDRCARRMTAVGKAAATDGARRSAASSARSPGLLEGTGQARHRPLRRDRHHAARCAR